MRYPTNYKLTGTRSFRLGSAAWFEKYGGNLQNPSSDTLSVFRAPPGRRIVQADQAGAEALVMAYLARPGRYRTIFEVGTKPHTYLALHTFANQRPDWFVNSPTARDRFLAAEPEILVALDGWRELDYLIRKKSPDEYYIGKKTAHMKSYRAGVRKYIESVVVDSEGKLVLTYDQGERFLLMFDAQFTEIIELQNEIEIEVRGQRVLYNLFGYPRQFNQLITDEYLREAISWKAQSTVGCLTHKAFSSTQSKIEEDNLDWHLISNKHDSLAIECKEEESVEAARWLKKSLTIDLVGRDGVKFTMGSEVFIGQNWADWDEEINQGGMKEIKV